MSITGIISTIFCTLAILLILLTGNIPKKFSSNHIILYISIADLLASIGMMFGYCQDRSTLCWIQTFLTNMGPICSVFWTSVILFIVWGHMTSRPTTISLPVHLLCWIFPTLISLLPLTTNRYGCLPGESECWCFIADREDSPSWTGLFWVYMLYVWIWIALIAYFLFLCILSYYKVEGSRIQVNSVIVRKLVGYPIILLISWSLISIQDLLIYDSSKLIESQIYQILFVCLPGLQGFLTASLYFISFYLSRKERILVMSNNIQKLHPNLIQDILSFVIPCCWSRSKVYPSFENLKDAPSQSVPRHNL